MRPKVHSLPPKQLLISAILAIASIDATAICLPYAPLQSMMVVSNWGYRVYPHSQHKMPDGSVYIRPHKGIDLRARYVPVYATHDGKVTAGYNNGRGNYIEILGTGAFDKLTTVNMHLSDFSVRNGQLVHAGDQIGITGETGENIKGFPHLHFETRIDKGQTPLDPRGYLCPVPPWDKSQVSQTFDLTDKTKPVPNPYPSKGDGTLTAKPGGAASSAPEKPVIADANGNVGSPNPKIDPSITTPSPGGGIPPNAPFPKFGGISTVDFLATETSKRFLNPTWFRDLLNPGAAAAALVENAGKVLSYAIDPVRMMQREIAIMAGISNAVTYETYMIRQNTSAMLATLLAIRAKQNTQETLMAIRNNTVN